LTLSTICQPGDTSDYWLPPVQQPWGLVSLDWSIANGIWRNKNMSLSTVEATSIENCRRIKAQAPTTRCFIYHNMELALQAFESQRAVMYDPSKADWFLQFTDGQGNKNGTIYNEPGGPGDQFFWDFRVPAAAEYFIDSVLSTLTDPAIDGTFTDDVVGFRELDLAPATVSHRLLPGAPPPPAHHVHPPSHPPFTPHACCSRRAHARPRQHQDERI